MRYQIEVLYELVDIILISNNKGIEIRLQEDKLKLVENDNRREMNMQGKRQNNIDAIDNDIAESDAAYKMFDTMIVKVKNKL